MAAQPAVPRLFIEAAGPPLFDDGLDPEGVLADVTAEADPLCLDGGAECVRWLCRFASFWAVSLLSPCRTLCDESGARGTRSLAVVVARPSSLSCRTLG